MKKLLIIPLIFLISCGQPLSVNQGELGLNKTVKYCNYKNNSKTLTLSGEFTDHQNNTLTFRSNYIYKIHIPEDTKYKIAFNRHIEITIKCSNNKWKLI